MHNHLFIVTYGRTGSTLLLGILNADPQIRIMGENSGLFQEIWHSLKTLGDLRKQSLNIDEDTPLHPHPYYGATSFPFELFRTELTGLLGRFLPDDPSITTTGFKEVRYDMPDLENYLDFLKSHFANTRFVFLTRDHDAVINSGFYKNVHPDHLRDYLCVIEQRFQNYAASDPAESFQITYKDLMSFDRIRELFSFIGHTASEESWRDVVSTKHSYAQRAVMELTPYSSVVVFDSARQWLDALHFEISNRVIKLMSELPLTGVLLPSAAAGELQSLVFRTGTIEYAAKTGIPSPGYAQKFPENPLASNARFHFCDSPPSLAHGIVDFDLIATFANAGTHIIGRLFSSPQKP